MHEDLGEHRWWLSDDDDLAAAIRSAASACDQASGDRQLRQVDYYCLYGDESVLPTGSYDVNEGERLNSNHTANAIDTVVSEITQTRPRPMTVTIGGDWFDRQRARDMTHYGDAFFEVADYYSHAEAAARDAAIGGVGFLQPYIHPSWGDIRLRRILPFNVLYDDDGLTEETLTYFIRHLYERSTAVAVWPEHAEEIDSAPAVDDTQWWADVNTYTDQVVVWEAVHLPTGPPECDEDGEEDEASCDGRHAIICGDAVLSDEPYPHDELPFAIIHAIKPVTGSTGGSLVARMQALQGEHNELSERIQDSHYLGSSPMWLVPTGANVEIGHFDNEVGNIMKFAGNIPPRWYTPTPMSPAVYEMWSQLKAEIYEAAGVSQLSATSLKPKGLDSGIALQTYNDVQSRRFINYERNFETLAIDTFAIVVKLNVKLSKDDPDHEVVFEDKASGRRDRIKWSEVNLERDAFRVRVFPASAFPTNPAAKLQMLQGMRDTGDIDSDTFFELVDIPDAEGTVKRKTAPRQLLLKRIGSMLRTGKYLAPDSYMDLELALMVTSIELQTAELEDVPEERLGLLRRFLADVSAMIDAAKPPPEAAPMGPEGMGMDPMAMGGDPGMMPEGMPPEMMGGEMPPDMLPPDDMGPLPEGMPPGDLPLPPEMMQ